MAEGLELGQSNIIFENMKVGDIATISGVYGNVAVGYTPNSGFYYAYRTSGVRELLKPVVVKKVLLPDGPNSSTSNPFFVVEVPNSISYTIATVYAVLSGTVIELLTK